MSDMDTAAGLKFLREKHVKFFKRSLDILPEQCAFLETSRMTIVFFCIAGLDILNELDFVEKDKLIDWIYTHQIVPNEAGDNIIRCGFRGCKANGSESVPFESSNIAMTFSSLLTLLVLGDDFSRVNKDAISKALQSLQLPDGSYCSTPYGSENDMRFVFCAAAICAVLDDWRGMVIDRVKQYILDSQTYEGGFGQGPGPEAHGGTTFCAVATLRLIGCLETTLDAERLSRLRRWCICRQETGFQGRPNKPIDTCYSFWVGATLHLLNIPDTMNIAENRHWLYSTQDNITGGFSKVPHSSPDVLHTFFGLCGLSLCNEDKLSSINPVLMITNRALRDANFIKNTSLQD